MQANPEVEIDLSTTDKVLDFVDNGLEAAIRFGTIDLPNMRVDSLQPYHLILCASPEYLSVRPSLRSLTDLVEHECIAFGHLPGSEWWTPRPSWRLRKTPGADFVVETPIVSRLKIDSAAGIRRACLQGMGIALLPKIAVEEDIVAGRICPVLEPFWPSPRAVSLIYRKDRRRSPRLESFVRFVIEMFGLKSTPHLTPLQK